MFMKVMHAFSTVLYREERREWRERGEREERERGEERVREGEREEGQT